LLCEIYFAARSYYLSQVFNVGIALQAGMGIACIFDFHRQHRAVSLVNGNARHFRQAFGRGER